MIAEELQNKIQAISQAKYINYIWTIVAWYDIIDKFLYLFPQKTRYYLENIIKSNDPSILYENLRKLKLNDKNVYSISIDYLLQQNETFFIININYAWKHTIIKIYIYYFVSKYK